MKNEIRIYISLKLLNWSFDIMPECEFKLQLAKLIRDRIMNSI